MSADCADWVPLGASRVADMLAADRPDHERELIKRLLTHDKMESVWFEIGKCRASPVARQQWSMLFDAMPGDDMDDDDVAVGMFFFWACHHAWYTPVCETRGERKALLHLVLEPVGQLRDAAARMRPGSPAMLNHVAAVNAAADFLEREMSRLYGEPHATLVTRNRGDRRHTAMRSRWRVRSAACSGNRSRENRCTARSPR